MTQTLTITPALSPSFGRAKKFSRFLAIFFTLAFWLMLFVLVANLVTEIFPFPNVGVGLEHGIRIPTGDLRGGQAIGAAVAANLVLIPAILILHHIRKLFFCFARGEVFAAQPIAHMRAVGIWLTVSFFTGIAAVLLLQICGVQNLLGPFHFPGGVLALLIEFKGALLTGIATTIAAYVLEEARRIAADHAEIV